MYTNQTDKVLRMYLISLGNIYQLFILTLKPFLDHVWKIKAHRIPKAHTTYLRWSYLVADLEFGLEVNNTVAAGNYSKESTGTRGSSYTPECWRKSVNGGFLFGKVSILEDEAEVVAGDQIPPRPPGWIDRILDHCMPLFFLNSVTHWN